MDAFEAVVAMILEGHGYWARTSYKVALTKPEKVEIGRPSSPRWELDVVGYKPAANELLVVECKSYLDSYGVRHAHFRTTEQAGNKRYKLFNEPETWEVVSRRLVRQLVEKGLILPEPRVQLCLAAGNVRNEADREKLSALFDERGWQLWDEYWLNAQLRDLADSKYENEVAAVVAKLLLRPDAPT